MLNETDRLPQPYQHSEHLFKVPALFPFEFSGQVDRTLYTTT